MKYLHMKLTAVAVLVGLLSLGFSPKLDSSPKIEKEIMVTDSTEISYDNLPGFVREFLYKGYEVKPEDVRKIIRFMDGAFLVKMNKSVNVFGIDADVKMHHQKLEFIDLGTSNRMRKSRSVQMKTKKKHVKQIRPISQESEIAWGTMPAHVREYLIKRMEAAEDQVHKAYDLGNDTYKIVLKEAHDEFVILEDSPHKIAF